MNLFKRIVSLVLTIFLFIGIFTVSAAAAGGTQKLGVAWITASSLRLRSQPNTSSTTLNYAYNGEVVVLEEKVGDWYKVSFNLQTGYMHSKYLNVVDKENVELGYGRVNGSRVNIRSGAGTGYSVLVQANVGTKAYIIGINNGWYKIIIGQTIGYIRSDYLDLTEIPYENRASLNKPLFFRGGKSTGIVPSASALNGSVTSDIRQKLVATAKQYIGVPYLWGGSTPSGFDCSGFVQYVFQKHGITLPRTSKQQWTAGTQITKSELQPGDLVFFANTYTTGISHLGIYIGNNQFIHASSSKGVTITSLSNSYWASHYHGARRIV